MLTQHPPKDYYVTGRPPYDFPSWEAYDAWRKARSFRKSFISAVIAAGIMAIVGLCGFCVATGTAQGAELIDLNKIAFIESSNNPKAVSRDGSIGLHQVSQPCLSDWNSAHPGQRYVLKDMLEPVKSTWVADWYFNVRIPALLKHYKIEASTLNIIAAYNWGIGNVVKWQKTGAQFEQMPRITQRYYRKYTSM